MGCWTCSRTQSVAARTRSGSTGATWTPLPKASGSRSRTSSRLSGSSSSGGPQPRLEATVEGLDHRNEPRVDSDRAHIACLETGGLALHMHLKDVEKVGPIGARVAENGRPALGRREALLEELDRGGVQRMAG